MTHEYHEMDDFEIPADILTEIADFQGSDVTVEQTAPKPIFTAEYAFTPQSFAQLINQTMTIAKGILARANRQRKLEWAEQNHERKVMARRSGVEYTPTAFVARPLVKPEDMHQDLIAAAMLHLFSTSKQWATPFNLLARQTESIYKQVNEVKATAKSISETLNGEKEPSANERQELLSALQLAEQNEALLEATLKGLKDVVIAYDAQPVKAYLTDSLSYKKIKEIRAIFFGLISDQANTLRQKPGTLSRHVAKGLCDTAMPIATVTDRLLSSVRGEANYTSTSRAQRDSESVYQDSNDVAILDAETAHVTTQLLGLLGYNNGSLIEVLNGGRVQVVIQEIEETIRIFEKTLEEQRAIEDIEELRDQTLDAATLFDLTVTLDALREQLDAYTAPSCSGTAYALGSGGLRRLYVVPS